MRAIATVLALLATVGMTRAGDVVAYGRVPLRFEENVGQADARAAFLARGPGYVIFITPAGASLKLHSAGSVDLRVVGASAKAAPRGEGVLTSRSNYFVGNDRAKWVTGVPHHARVVVEAVYPGIDLVYYGNQRELEFDFVVAPGVDPARIRLAFDGAKELGLDRDGALRLGTAGGTVTLRAPVLHQRGDTRVDGGFVLLGGNEVGFRVGAYDSTRPLVIDPVLVYSTYLGGTENGLSEGALAIAADGNGCAYVTGLAPSLDFPTANPLQAANAGGMDAFVAKLSADGSSLVYSTYLGGSDHDSGGKGIAVDAAGCAYVTGNTRSTDFPTVNAFQAAHGGAEDAFVAKLSADGSALLFSTYLGGSGNEVGHAIAVDGDGRVHVAGRTHSPDFPTQSPWQATKASTDSTPDAFVAKFDASGTALVYSTFLGGTKGEVAWGIAVDGSGNAWIAGNTSSNANFPILNALQPLYWGGASDAFVAKFDSAGVCLCATFLGGSSDDIAGDIAVDPSGNAYVTGKTKSSNFPVTAGAFQTVRRGPDDAFVTKIAASGASIVYSTYLGGTASEYPLGTGGIEVDAAGYAYVCGGTTSPDFPVLNATQQKIGGPAKLKKNQSYAFDAFVTKLQPSGGALAYSTYLGGSLLEDNAQIAIDGAGAAYVCGLTYSADYPTANAFQAARGGQRDGFVAKIGP